MTLPSEDTFIAVTARSTNSSRDVKMALERLLRFGWCRQTFSELICLRRVSVKKNTRLLSKCCFTVQIDAQHWLHYFAEILAQRWPSPDLGDFSLVTLLKFLESTASVVILPSAQFRLVANYPRCCGRIACCRCQNMPSSTTASISAHRACS